MSIGDFLRREWLSEYFDYDNVAAVVGDDNVHRYLIDDRHSKQYGLVIIDVQSFVYIENRDDSRVPNLKRVQDSITNYVEEFGRTQVILVMPNQKTRNCYYRSLEDSHRYDHLNHHYLKGYSSFMIELQRALIKTYSTSNSNVMVTEQNVVAMENEMVMTYSIDYLNYDKSGTVFVYTISPDMFIFSLNIDSSMSQRFFFGYASSIYSMSNCYNVLRHPFRMYNDKDFAVVITPYLVFLLSLFGNTFSPQEYSLYIYGASRVSNVFVFNSIIVRTIEYARTRLGGMPVSIRSKGRIKLADEFINGVLMETSYYEETLSYRSDDILNDLDIPTKINVLGSRDNHITESSMTETINAPDSTETTETTVKREGTLPADLGNVYDDYITSAGQSLIYIVNSNLNYYALKFGKINKNIFYDHSLFDVSYVDDNRRPMAILSRFTDDVHIYSNIEYILRTSSSKDLKRIHDSKVYVRESHGPIIAGIYSRLVTPSTGDSLLRFMYPTSISAYTEVGDYAMFIDQSKMTNFSYYFVLVPRRRLTLYYCKYYDTHYATTN